MSTEYCCEKMKELLFLSPFELRDDYTIFPAWNAEFIDGEAEIEPYKKMKFKFCPYCGVRV